MSESEIFCHEWDVLLQYIAFKTCSVIFFTFLSVLNPLFHRCASVHFIISRHLLLLLVFFQRTNVLLKKSKSWMIFS